MRRTHRTSHRIRSTAISAGNAGNAGDFSSDDTVQLALPELAELPERRDAGPAASPRASHRTRRSPMPRRRGDDDQRQALQLALVLAERSVAEAHDDGASVVEAARRAAMERSREALRARLELVPNPRATEREARGDDADPFPADPPADSTIHHDFVRTEEPSEVIFVGRLPPKGTLGVVELVAERLSLPPPRGGFHLQRPSGGALLEHRTEKAWLRISRVSSGLHVLLAGEARSRWLGDIRAAVRELGLVEAE